MSSYLFYKKRSPKDNDCSSTTVPIHSASFGKENQNKRGYCGSDEETNFFSDSTEESLDDEYSESLLQEAEDVKEVRTDDFSPMSKVPRLCFYIGKSECGQESLYQMQTILNSQHSNNFFKSLHHYLFSHQPGKTIYPGLQNKSSGQITFDDIFIGTKNDNNQEIQTIADSESDSDELDACFDFYSEWGTSAGSCDTKSENALKYDTLPCTSSFLDCIETAAGPSNIQPELDSPDNTSSKPAAWSFGSPPKEPNSEGLLFEPYGDECFIQWLEEVKSSYPKGPYNRNNELTLPEVPQNSLELNYNAANPSRYDIWDWIKFSKFNINKLHGSSPNDNDSINRKEAHTVYSDLPQKKNPNIHINNKSFLDTELQHKDKNKGELQDIHRNRSFPNYSPDKRSQSPNTAHDDKHFYHAFPNNYGNYYWHGGDEEKYFHKDALDVTEPQEDTEPSVWTIFRRSTCSDDEIIPNEEAYRDSDINTQKYWVDGYDSQYFDSSTSHQQVKCSNNNWDGSLEDGTTRPLTYSINYDQRQPKSRTPLDNTYFLRLMNEEVSRFRYFLEAKGNSLDAVYIDLGHKNGREMFTKDNLNVSTYELDYKLPSPNPDKEDVLFNEWRLFLKRN